MGHSSKRRRTTAPHRITSVLGLLSCSTLVQAVALSDFTPQLINLSNPCQQIYTLPISGCTRDELDSSKARVCSQQCLAGLVQTNNAVNRFCAQDDVPEVSIVGLFKLGQAIQLLCNVAVVTQSPGGTTGPIPIDPRNTFTSTMTMSMSNSLTSSPLSQTQSPTTQSRPTSNGMIGNTPIRPSPSSTTSSPPPPPSSTGSSLSLPSSATSTRSTGTTTGGLTGAALESLKSGNVGGGGGSPFDNIDNSEAASLRAAGTFAASILGATILGMAFTLT